MESTEGSALPLRYPPTHSEHCPMVRIEVNLYARETYCPLFMLPEDRKKESSHADEIAQQEKGLGDKADD